MPAPLNPRPKGTGKDSLPEVHGSIGIPYHKSFLRRLLAISGPAFLVAVGYMDPGNWATDLAAGSGFNYSLIWVLLMSNVMAVLLQGLAFRLGIVRGLDLAQACRGEYPRIVNLSLYVLCEIAITACDLAEVIGSAIALQLLFGIPLLWGVLITAADTFALLFLNHLGIRKLEAFILSLITIIAGAFFYQVVLARPEWPQVAAGFVPSLPSATALFIAIGMLGATVMPHNLYLHSSLVQTRRIGDKPSEKRQAIKLNTIDSTLALNMAFFVNAAILIVAAAAFYRHGHHDVAEIQDAHRLLEPLLGTALAPIAFAIALLASGQSSTITGTLAGQIVMEGFLNFRLPPWVRRLITRLLAITPAVITIVYFGERGTGKLLVLSQVVLSLQLPFAIIPLIHFVSDRAKMGEFTIGRWIRALAWIAAVIIVGLNIKLVAQFVADWIAAFGGRAVWIYLMIVPMAAAVGALMLYVTLKPIVPRIMEHRRISRGTGVHEPAEDLSGLKDALGKAVASPMFNRVAVCLDFSGRDNEILAETLRFLGGAKTELRLMHVVESAPARYLGKESADIESQQDLPRLERYAAELRALGFVASTAVGYGKPLPELIRLIEDYKPDLVVLGAHGHRFVSDIIHGATADKLRHRIKSSVLIVAKKPLSSHCYEKNCS